MARSQNEGLVAAPLFTPHRINVTTADATPPSATIKFAHGMDANEWDEIVANVKLGSNTTGAVVEVLMWSSLDAAYVKQEPVDSGSFTASRSIRFNVAGRRFFLHVSGLTGSSPRVDIDVAGGSRDI